MTLISRRPDWHTHTTACRALPLEIIARELDANRSRASIFRKEQDARRAPLVIAPPQWRRHFAAALARSTLSTCACARARARGWYVKSRVACGGAGRPRNPRKRASGLARRGVPDDVTKRRRADCLAWRSTTTERRMYPPTDRVRVYVCVFVRARGKETVDERALDDEFGKSVRAIYSVPRVERRILAFLWVIDNRYGTIRNIRLHGFCFLRA